MISLKHQYLTRKEAVNLGREYVRIVFSLTQEKAVVQQ
jgi:hypothetical protein